MFCILFKADFKVAMLVYVEIFFDLVVVFFLLFFKIFFLFELSVCCLHFLMFVGKFFFRFYLMVFG